MAQLIGMASLIFEAAYRYGICMLLVNRAHKRQTGSPPHQVHLCRSMWPMTRRSVGALTLYLGFNWARMSMLCMHSMLDFLMPQRVEAAGTRRSRACKNEQCLAHLCKLSRAVEQLGGTTEETARPQRVVHQHDLGVERWLHEAQHVNDRVDDPVHMSHISAQLAIRIHNYTHPRHRPL